MTWVDQHQPGKKLVAPALSARTYPPERDYHTWLPAFRDAVTQKCNRHPYALAAHCYAVAPISTWQDCEGIVQWYETQVTSWNIPGGVWVTEYGFPASGCQGASCNWTSAVDALNGFTDWLQSRPLVQRYAWFTNRSTRQEQWLGLDSTYTLELMQCPTIGTVTCTMGSTLSPLGVVYGAQ